MRTKSVSSLSLGHALALGGVEHVDQLIIAIDGHHPVRRQALDGERTGDAHLGLVLIGLVIEEFIVGPGGDGGVDLGLAGDAGGPECLQPGDGGDRPAARGLARQLPLHEAVGRGHLARGQFDLAGSGEVDLRPFAPASLDLERRGMARQRRIERRTGRLDGGLARLPDDVDLGIADDGFESDVRHALIDETVADTALGRRGLRRSTGERALLGLTLGTVGKQIERVARAHQTGTGQRDSDPAGINGDPAPPPLFGYIGGGARAAGRIKHQVAGVRGHEDAAFNYFGSRLHDVMFVGRAPNIAPDIIDRIGGKIINSAKISYRLCLGHNSASDLQPRHSQFTSLPAGLKRGFENTSFNRDREP